MGLDTDFELSQPLPEKIGGADQIVKGRELSSGYDVEIHFLGGGQSAENNQLLDAARRLPPQTIRYLRRIGEYKDSLYVVTEPLPNSLSFRTWLSTTASKPEQHHPGEFTQMLEALPPPKPPTASRSQVPSATPAAEVPKSGEFTRLVQRPGVQRPTPPAPVDAQALRSAPAPKPPGEFTRLLNNSAPAPADPARDPAALEFGSAPEHPSESPLTAAAPGEFTRMLQSPLAPTPEPPLFSPSTESASERSQGGFTQLFESPFSSPEPAQARGFIPSTGPVSPSEPVAWERNEFDRLFAEQNAPATAAPNSGGDATRIFTSHDVPPAPAAAQEQSEYTRMFKTGGQPPASAPAPSATAPKSPPPSAPATAATSKRPTLYLTLIYVLSGLLAIAIIAIIYLLRRH